MHPIALSGRVLRVPPARVAVWPGGVDEIVGHEGDQEVRQGRRAGGREVRIHGVQTAGGTLTRQRPWLARQFRLSAVLSGTWGQEIRNPKPELRNKSETRNPKPEPARRGGSAPWNSTRSVGLAGRERHARSPRPPSGPGLFGLRVSDLFRSSGFGFRFWPRCHSTQNSEEPLL